MSMIFPLFFLAACLLLPLAAGIFAPFWVAMVVAALFLLMGMRMEGSPAAIPWMSAVATVCVAVTAAVVRNWAGILQWLVTHTT
jgi:hypothetical protein